MRRAMRDMIFGLLLLELPATDVDLERRDVVGLLEEAEPGADEDPD